jgi:hypothetical protein
MNKNARKKAYKASEEKSLHTRKIVPSEGISAILVDKQVAASIKRIVNDKVDTALLRERIGLFSRLDKISFESSFALQVKSLKVILFASDGSSRRIGAGRRNDVLSMSYKPNAGSHQRGDTHRREWTELKKLNVHTPSKLLTRSALIDAEFLTARVEGKLIEFLSGSMRAITLATSGNNVAVSGSQYNDFQLIRKRKGNKQLASKSDAGGFVYHSKFEYSGPINAEGERGTIIGIPAGRRKFDKEGNKIEYASDEPELPVDLSTKTIPESKSRVGNARKEIRFGKADTRKPAVGADPAKLDYYRRIDKESALRESKLIVASLVARSSIEIVLTLLATQINLFE